MLVLYVLLALLGLALTVVLARRRSGHALTAIVGAVLAGLAIPTGFSIGIYLAAAALPFIAVATAQVQRRNNQSPNVAAANALR